MERFLKAKHWQIFLVTIGLPFILQIIIMPVSIFTGNPMLLFKLMPVIMVVFMAGFFGWFWSIAIGLQTKIPANVKLKVEKFKIFFFIPLIYIFIISIFFVFIGNWIEGGNNPGSGRIGLIMGIIVPLHLFSMFCIFYCLYFVAKTFKTVELQREVTFSDFGGEFFLFWFFPIGVWIVQPKINKFIDDNLR